MSEHEAGRGLDALVAERVMGWTGFVHPSATCHPEFDVTATPPQWDATRYHRVPEYSTDIAAAWEVVEKLRPRLCGRIAIDVNARDIAVGMSIDDDAQASAKAESLPLAICRAALKAVSVPA